MAQKKITKKKVPETEVPNAVEQKRGAFAKLLQGFTSKKAK